jgi:uncharacterized protein (DUF924 family)
MPLQHAEVLEAQEESLAAYRRLCAEGPPALHVPLAETLRYAQAHHSLIARFGRFPERNAALGRASTEPERRYLNRS